MTTFSTLLLMVLPGAGGNDLLDYVSLERFWARQGIPITAKAMIGQLTPSKPSGNAAELIGKLGDQKFKVREDASKRLQEFGPSIIPQLQKAAQSDDFEVRSRARKLIKDFRVSGASEHTRRLVAIRTIAVHKMNEALRALQALVESKEPFVADYARESIAALQGKPYQRGKPTADQLAGDLALLPTDCGLVAQLKVPRIDPSKVFETLKGYKSSPFGGALKEMNRGILEALKHLGNARFDAVTIGLSKEVGRSGPGYVVAVYRGQYDVQAMETLLRKEARVEPVRVNGVDVWKPDRNVGMIFPSANRMVFFGGDRGASLPTEHIIAALKAKDGKLHFSADMAKLIRSVDRSKSAWLVATMGETYREVPFFKSIDWISVEADQSADGSIDFQLKAAGKEAAKVQASVDLFNSELGKARKQFKDVEALMPILKPAGEFLESIRIQARGTNVAGTAKIKDITNVLLMPMLALYSFADPFEDDLDVGPIEIEEAAPARRAVPIRPVPRKTTR